VQTPPRHVSFAVQEFASLHAAPSLPAGCEHVPPLQRSSVQGSPSLQLIGVWVQDLGPRSTTLAAPVTHVGFPVSVPWLFVPAVSAVVPPVPSLKAKAPRRPVPIPICWNRLAWISACVRAWPQIRTSSICPPKKPAAAPFESSAEAIPTGTMLSARGEKPGHRGAGTGGLESSVSSVPLT